MSKNDQSLGDLVKRFAEQRQIKPGLVQKRVESAWKSVMGEWIARETKKIRVHGSQLTLTVESPALRQELYYNSAEVMKRLNDHFKEEVITSVVVR